MRRLSIDNKASEGIKSQQARTTSRGLVSETENRVSSIIYIFITRVLVKGCKLRAKKNFSESTEIRNFVFVTKVV